MAKSRFFSHFFVLIKKNCTFVHYNYKLTEDAVYEKYKHHASKRYYTN